MANQNLFEKYGIKEVADVTFYRIERKNEVYESQREISVSSILKGAITTQMVYPMDEGKGADTGFEAYVFADADILTHANYDCDGTITKNATVTVTLTGSNDSTLTPSALIKKEGIKVTGDLTEIPNGAAIAEGQSNEPITGTGDLGGPYSYNAEIEISYPVDATSSDFGTHEYSYAEQVLMLFAKKQDLVQNTGVGYQVRATGMF